MSLILINNRLSSFGVIDVKNIGKGTVGGRVFVNTDFGLLYLFDRSSGLWRIFKPDNYSDNAPMDIKFIVDQGNGKYYQYFAD